MITKDWLARLRAERRQPNARFEYTIDGPVHTRVVSSLDAQREKQILRGDRTLQNALDDFRREQAFNSRYGLAKAQFNQSTEEPKL